VFIVNTPHHARRHLGLEYEDVAALNPRLIYADLTGFGEKGPDADLPGFDLTAFWARSGLLAMTHDAGAAPTWPVSGSGDNATAVSLYAAIATALYHRERTGLGSYVTTSLLASGVWSAGVMVAGALAGASMPALLDRAHPANAGANVYRSSDGVWFVLVAQPEKVADMVKAMGHEDLLTDPRFADPAKLAANRAVLTAIFEEAFLAKPMAYWADLLGKINVTFGTVNGPEDVIKDPQLSANDIVVPLDGAGKLTQTISSPFKVHGVDKAPARRGPDLGEHTEEILHELGFDDKSIESFREDGAIPDAEKRAA
jgi:formyl-CoA transferase